MKPFIIFALLLLIGYQQKEQVFRSRYTTPVTVEQIPEDAPMFLRKYKADFGNGVSAEIQGLSFQTRKLHGWFHYKGNVYPFSPADVGADIPDKSYVNRVQEVTDQALELDNEFMNKNSAEFLDAAGNRWKKVQ